MNNENITTLTIKDLFENNDNYVIPIYQRNFAWTISEITQLIQDIYDFSTDEDKKNKNYYIGSLVVYKKVKDDEEIYETIDGQQRLTALNIILSGIKNDLSNHYNSKTFDWYDNINLKFDVREKSTKTLKALFDDKVYNHEKFDANIKQSYLDSIKFLKEKELFPKPQKFNEFLNFFENNVVILRVEVPDDTDLNHYFEIMNNRGEQLEKHEILKSYFIEILEGDGSSEHSKKTFNQIWNACSNMDKYVQMGFEKKDRKILFGEEWNTFQLEKFEDVKNVSVSKNPVVKQNLNLLDIINSTQDSKPKNISKEPIDEIGNRFNSVINFSNFLLHVLRIQTEDNVPLDDKRLLDIFEPYLKTDDKETRIKFAKDFGFNLLKCKFLFDTYVIKREYLANKNQWSLKTLQYYPENKNWNFKNTFSEAENQDLIMIMAMFHVSFPTLVYKHWLNAILYFLFKSADFNSDNLQLNLKNYLENLAKAFLFNRFLINKDEPIDYFEIIYTNDGICKDHEIDMKKLDKGVNVENFIFNYLDYLLWQDDKNKFKEFEFTFRSSIEHFYPQKPKESHMEMEVEIANNFGNLCLISSRENSELSNKTPKEKRIHHQETNLKMESIKQQLMFKIEEEREWKEKEIQEHGNEMKEIFKKIQDNLTKDEDNYSSNAVVIKDKPP
ncbi:MAG: DUF262 domain-containing HNH endonuclease family protein [Methanobrevibacter sp.]|nr:DUF262 domain-containing HNH endonuclease family protein [Methanobrevibacter sp.]